MTKPGRIERALRTRKFQSIWRGIALAILGIAASAAPALALTSYSTLTTVRVDATFGYNIVMSSATHGCTGFNRSFYIATSTANAAEMFKTAMAAFLAGKNVQVAYDCIANKAQITQLSMGSE